MFVYTIQTLSGSGVGRVDVRRGIQPETHATKTHKF